MYGCGFFVSVYPYLFIFIGKLSLPLAEICHWHFGFSLLTDIFERHCMFMLDFLNMSILS